jgi:hypothetical protein
VLDLGVILAIPSCGRTLVEFGADVIKIDSPHRNPVPWHNDVNRGKRSLLLDLKTLAGLEIFWRLLENADVVLENFRTAWRKSSASVTRPCVRASPISSTARSTPMDRRRAMPNGPGAKC